LAPKASLKVREVREFGKDVTNAASSAHNHGVVKDKVNILGLKLLVEYY